MFKAAAKSKCLAFLAVITLFSAVIFAGGCNGSSTSTPSPSKTVSVEVLGGGKMDNVFAEALQKAGIIVEALGPHIIYTVANTSHCRV